MSFRNLPADGRVLAKVGISSVDEEGARLNVEAEIPNWDFEGVMKQANTAWNEALGKIDIETSDNDSRTVFYTSLYHAFIQPSLASDVDGRYRTMGHEIKQDASYTNYTVFSLWDTFRAAHPLYTIVTPEQNQAFIRSLLRKYDEGGILPKWELASNETGTMIGYHAVSVIADAMMKKQCDFDVKKALEACIRSSVYDTTGVTPMMDRQILNGKLMPVSIKYKNELGCDKVGGSVSQGLEFAYNDWLIAQMMKEHNRKDLYDKYMELSRNYRNYFDPETKLMTGDPNAAADVTGMIGQYAHGNEPSHHIPYLYNYAGAPRKTQALVDHILRTLYHNDPNGLSGNEDVGQMSAWYALSAMGFYSFCPGRPVYEIGRPIFDKVTIHLSNGKDFVIQAKNNSVENKYIRSMKLNGEDLAEPRFSHFDLMKGGELIFEMEN